jgi:hypothetical protein
MKTVTIVAVACTILLTFVHMFGGTVQGQARRSARVIAVNSGTVISLGDARVAGIACSMNYFDVQACFVVVEDK